MGDPIFHPILDPILATKKPRGTVKTGQNLTEICSVILVGYRRESQVGRSKKILSYEKGPPLLWLAHCCGASGNSALACRLASVRSEGTSQGS